MSRARLVPGTAALLLGLALLAVSAGAPPAVASGADSSRTGSPFFSAEDGMLDISTFMEGRYGFIPIAFPITEPAVGYGAGALLAFMDRPRAAAQAGFGRPDISMLGGLATENGTWALMAADVRFWRQDRLKTLVAAAHASLNLDFGGIGTGTGGETALLGYNLLSRFVTLQAMARLGGTRLWAGVRYAFATTDVAFDAAEGVPGLPEDGRRSDVGSLAPSLVYDSRDNTFTPRSGTYAEAYAGAYRSWLGSDEEFEKFDLIGIQYLTLSPRVFLGLRADVKSVRGGAPFYVLPYVAMRGVAAMRYQGELVTQGEAELRWQFSGRWSVVGFAGTGIAAANAAETDFAHSVEAGGVGFRYELARRFGIHTGVDVAWGPDEAAIYFQTGSAWGRP